MYRLVIAGRDIDYDKDTFGTRDVAIEEAIKRSKGTEVRYYDPVGAMAINPNTPDPYVTRRNPVEVFVEDQQAKGPTVRIGAAYDGVWSWFITVKQPYAA